MAPLQANPVVTSTSCSLCVCRAWVHGRHLLSHLNPRLPRRPPPARAARDLQYPSRASLGTLDPVHCLVQLPSLQTKTRAQSVQLRTALPRSRIALWRKRLPTLGVSFTTAPLSTSTMGTACQLVQCHLRHLGLHQIDGEPTHQALQSHSSATGAYTHLATPPLARLARSHLSKTRPVSHPSFTHHPHRCRLPNHRLRRGSNVPALSLRSAHSAPHLTEDDGRANPP